MARELLLIRLEFVVGTVVVVVVVVVVVDDINDSIVVSWSWMVVSICSVVISVSSLASVVCCLMATGFSLGGKNFLLPFFENLEILKVGLGSATLGEAGLNPNGSPASLGLGALGENREGLLRRISPAEAWGCGKAVVVEGEASLLPTDAGVKISGRF